MSGVSPYFRHILDDLLFTQPGQPSLVWSCLAANPTLWWSLVPPESDPCMRQEFILQTQEMAATATAALDSSLTLTRSKWD